MLPLGGLSGNFLRAANLFNGLGLLAVSGFFFWRAIEHLFHPPPVLGVIPIAAGLLGAVGNWGVARALRESSREDPAIRLAYVHNVTDVLMSLAPVLAGVLVVVCRNFLFDPLIALMIGVVVVISTCRALVESRRKLLWPESVTCGPRRLSLPMRSWYEVLVVTGLLAGFFGCATRSASPREDPGATAAAASNPNPHSAEDLDRYRQLLADPDQGIRITVARVLIEHGDLEGKPILLGALRSPDAHHRIDAALALQKLKDPETIADLRRAAQAERHPLARTILEEVLKEVSQ